MELDWGMESGVLRRYEGVRMIMVRCVRIPAINYGVLIIQRTPTTKQVRRTKNQIKIPRTMATYPDPDPNPTSTHAP
jgi:hypothetical protein